MPTTVVDLSPLMNLLLLMPVLLIFPLRLPLMDTDFMDTAVASSDLDMPTPSARDPLMLMPMPTTDMVWDMAMPTLAMLVILDMVDMLDTMVILDLLLMSTPPEPALPVW